MIEEPDELTLDYGYWSVPFHGIGPCGDAALITKSNRVHWLVVIDAIGHGVMAARIADRIIDLFDAALKSVPSNQRSPSQLLARFHAELSCRRQDEQAVVGLFKFTLSTAELDAAIVGNLDVVLLSPTGSIRLPGQWGMVGGMMPRQINQLKYIIGHDNVLAVFSDGIRFREMAANLNHLVYHEHRHAPLNRTAKSLVDLYHRQHDDSSCALVQIKRLVDG
jgi:hypothetical protein